MSSTVSRTFNSVPARSASDTWRAISALLASSDGAKSTLQSIEGIACSLITDKAFASPLIITGTGPRVRIYCLYDDDAIEGDSANEQALAFDASQGDWSMSLPCPASDLAWVQAALKEKTTRITARDMAQGITLSDATEASQAVVSIDEEAFLGR